MKTHAERDASRPPAKRPGNRRPVVWQSRVRAVRTELGLTLKQVAAGAGVSITAVYYAELGVGVNLETARAISDYFGKSERELWPKKA